MSDPIRLHYLYTDYSHFGPHAGPRLLIDYIDPTAFSIRQTPVKKEKQQHGLPFLVARRLSRKYLTRQGMRFYYLEDFLAERSVSKVAAREATGLVHYIDADHSSQHLRRMLDARGRQQTKIINTHHLPPEQLERMVRKDTLQAVDHVFIVSPEQHSFFTQYLPEEKISIIELGVSAQFYTPAEHAPSDELFRTITVGSHMRDYDTLRAVAKKMEGEPIEFHAVSRSLDNDPASPNVRVHHGISDEALRTLYRESHLMLLPLKGATANSALLEGMACKIPIATNDLAGTRHYLPDDSRFFLPDRDPDTMVDFLRVRMKQPDLCRELAERGYARAQELAWPNIARRAENIYREVLGIDTTRT